MVGEILNGRYEILKSVGFGGMAEVYLAKDVLLDRKIAIKVLRKKFLDSKTQLEQFKREARSAARLIHPSIVTIYDVCDEGDISYILMEYVEGVSLKSFEEQNGRMDPALAVALTAQLASALAHAHKHNIIHCDIHGVYGFCGGLRALFFAGTGPGTGGDGAVGYLFSGHRLL